MLSQESALASEVLRIGATLRNDYGIDPEPLYAEAGIDAEACARPGARIAHETIGALWGRAITVAGDGQFGLKLGRAARPRDFFVLGYSWSASNTLLGAIERLIRFEKVVTSPYSESELEKIGSVYRISETFSEHIRSRIQPEVHDASLAGLLALCGDSLGEPIYPSRVAMLSPNCHHSGLHDELFRVDIEWDAGRNIIDLPADILEAELPGAVPEIAEASDRVAADYIREFETGTVATQVRQLIIRMLPAGRASQDEIAGQLYRSASTLQRQLSAEGTSFRDLMHGTRQDLAEQYLREGKFSQAEIAFMVGFSDQSNFARAFKRWTGQSPGEFQRAA